MISVIQISVCHFILNNGEHEKRRSGTWPDRLLIGLEREGLQWHSHLKDCPIAEACKGDNHITPEEHNVRSFREFQVTEQYEKGGLQEEQQCHFNQIAGKSHKSDG